MKSRLYIGFAVIAAALVLVSGVYAGSGDRKLSFRVERGDTYLNLFGPDWQKAYRQNKLTVIRKGRPVTSPDILVEGTIITVTPDVHLTPRAQTRSTDLKRRRMELSVQLTTIEPSLRNVPQMQSVAEECRQLLTDDLRFAADVDYVARELENLQRSARNRTVEGVPVSNQDGNHNRIGLLYGGFISLVVLTAIVSFFLLKRAQPAYPAGDARYREALRDVRDALRKAGAEP